MPDGIYLDNSATTAVAAEVVKAMEPYWSLKYGNPSSPHLKGLRAEKAIHTCRAELGRMLRVRPQELYFTASGTEANNLALQGVARTPFFLRYPGHIITTPIEHPSVRNVIKHLETVGWQVSFLTVDRQGRIDAEEIRALLRPDTRLVSIILVQNELGTIAPAEEGGAILRAENARRQHKIVYHLDAVQALGHIPLDLPRLGADLVSFSAHKIFGPKGIGLLYVHENTRLIPLLFGGGQENQLRPGTENVPAIVGLTKAVQLVLENLDQNLVHLGKLRRQLLEGLAGIEQTVVHSPPEGAPHIINVSFAGVRGEVLVHFLEQKGVFVSMGAACSSQQGPSHVLEALDLSREEILGAIRISLAPSLSSEEIDRALGALQEAIGEIRDIYT